MNQTLKRNGAGTHTLAMEFRVVGTNDLRWAAQNYVIEEDKADEGNGDQGDEGNNGQGDEGQDEEDEDDSTEQEAAVTSGTVIRYQIMPGDTLWGISEKFFGSGRSWGKIYEENMAVIPDPNKLRTGQTLTIFLNQGSSASYASPAVQNPAGAGTTSASGKNYVVKAGDNLYKIALGLYGQGGRWNEIYQMNRDIIADPKQIYTGQNLMIPE